MLLCILGSRVDSAIFQEALTCCSTRAAGTAVMCMLAETADSQCEDLDGLENSGVLTDWFALPVDPALVPNQLKTAAALLRLSRRVQQLEEEAEDKFNSINSKRLANKIYLQYFFCFLIY